MIFGRRKRCEQVMAGLHELLRDPTLDRRFIRECGIFYATVGRDRKMLDMGFVEKIRQGARDAAEFQLLVDRAMKEKRS